MITNLAQLRLMQLISPSFPLGAFTYSQGLEWCVETGWVTGAETVEQWLGDLLETSMQELEIPIALRMIKGWQENDIASIQHWSDLLIASRETSELRAEEKNRAAAMYRILLSLDLTELSQYESLIKSNQPAGYTYACVAWGIPAREACAGFLWSWLENLVISAVKLVPLGQTDGQKILLSLANKVDEVIDQSLQIKDQDVGCSSPALAIASAQHETQYTRLFRS